MDEWIIEPLGRAHQRSEFCFVALLDNPRHLYLPVATIEDAFGEQDPEAE
jgi:hypothetical protein